MTYVYLAGPISGQSYDGAVNWREEARAHLPTWINTLSPMRGKAMLKNVAVISETIENMPLVTAAGINCRDFNDVKRSSALLVNFLGVKKVSIGTVMEIAWAKAFKIPVVCVMEKENPHQHVMLNDACGFIVTTLDEGMYQLVQLLGDDDQVIAYNAKRYQDAVNKRNEIADNFKRDMDTLVEKNKKRRTEKEDDFWKSLAERCKQKNFPGIVDMNPKTSGFPYKQYPWPQEKSFPPDYWGQKFRDAATKIFGGEVKGNFAQKGSDYDFSVLDKYFGGTKGAAEKAIGPKPTSDSEKKNEEVRSEALGPKYVAGVDPIAPENGIFPPLPTFGCYVYKARQVGRTAFYLSEIEKAVGEMFHGKTKPTS